MKVVSKRIENEFINSLITEGYTLFSEYPGTGGRVSLQHDACLHRFEVSVNNFRNLGSRCPRCNNRSKSAAKKIFMDLLLIRGYTLIDEYMNSKDHVRIVHDECGHKFKIAPASFKCNMSKCPRCY